MNKNEKIKIEQAVRDFESKSSVEIVPYIVNSSKKYKWTHWVWFVIGQTLGSLLLVAYHFSDLWSVHLVDVFKYQFLMAGLFSVLSLFLPFKRFLIKFYDANEEVRQKAMAVFLELGLTETKKRNGMLIYISLLEHQAHILVDRDLQKQFSEEYWKNAVQFLVEKIKDVNASTAISLTIEKLSPDLIKAFPKELGDESKFSNSPHQT